MKMTSQAIGEILKMERVEIKQGLLMNHWGLLVIVKNCLKTILGIPTMACYYFGLTKEHLNHTLNILFKTKEMYLKNILASREAQNILRKKEMAKIRQSQKWSWPEK